MMDSPAQKKAGVGIEGFIAILAIIGITVHLLLRYLIPDLQAYSLYPLYIVLGFGGSILVFDLLRKLVTFQFGSDLLAGMAL